MLARLFLFMLNVLIIRECFMSFKKYECDICGFIYDEELGLPEEGIAPGTKWDDIPDDWQCPDCSVGKSDFNMVEIA